MHFSPTPFFESPDRKETPVPQLRVDTGQWTLDTQWTVYLVRTGLVERLVLADEGDGADSAVIVSPIKRTLINQLKLLQFCPISEF